MRDVRRRDERLQQGDLAGAVSDAKALADAEEEARARVARVCAALTAATDERDRRLAQGSASTILAQVDLYLRRLRRDLEAARGELLRAEARHRGQLEAVDAARGRLSLARADREIIERHFATWRAERRKLAERRDD